MVSPHQITRRSSGKSPARTTSSFAIRLKTEGTENHWVSCESRMNHASLCGSRFICAGTRCSCAPAPSVPNMSKVERSKFSGGCCDMRSDGENPKYDHAHSRKHRTL